MSDLIDRQAAIDALKHNQDIYSHNFHDDPIDKYTTAIIATDIDTLVKLPTAQPEPQEGHWIWVAGDLECSKCHTIFTDLYPDYDNSVACPHCGCKMEVEHDSDLHAE